MYYTTNPYHSHCCDHYYRRPFYEDLYFHRPKRHYRHHRDRYYSHYGNEYGWWDYY